MRVLKDSIKMMENLLEQINSKQEKSTSLPHQRDLQYVHEVVKILKDLETTCAMREGLNGQSSGMGNYSGGYSQGYSGNYSGNAGGYSGNNGGGYSGNNGYSGYSGAESAYGYSGNNGSNYNYSGYSGHGNEEEAKKQAARQLERMSNEAQSDHVRQALTEAMKRLYQ